MASRLEKPSPLCICLPCGALSFCSADFQSAVSPTCSRQRVGSVPRVGFPNALQNATLRYSAARQGRNKRSAGL